MEEKRKSLSEAAEETEHSEKQIKYCVNYYTEYLGIDLSDDFDFIFSEQQIEKLKEIKKAREYNKSHLKAKQALQKKEKPLKTTNEKMERKSKWKENLALGLALYSTIKKEIKDIVAVTKDVEREKKENENLIKPLFRTRPKSLREDDVIKMIKYWGFYEKDKNPNGKGFYHLYQNANYNGDKVVIDHESRLMWQQGGSERPHSYKSAIDYIKGLNNDKFAGFENWRLLTLEEALSLMEVGTNERGPFINEIFEKFGNPVWTIDNRGKAGGSSDRFWVVSFVNGRCYDSYANDYYYVRAVRSGLSSVII